VSSDRVEEPATLRPRRSPKHGAGLLGIGGGVPRREFGTLGQPKLMGHDKGYLKYLALVGEVGFVLVVCIGGGLLAGVLLDRWLGTGPALTLVLLFAGIAAGFIQVYRLLLPRNTQ